MKHVGQQSASIRTICDLQADNSALLALFEIDQNIWEDDRSRTIREIEESGHHTEKNLKRGKTMTGRLEKKRDYCRQVAQAANKQSQRYTDPLEAIKGKKKPYGNSIRQATSKL
ncbi:MAG: hypothetical protein Q9180_004368 [Flavoplaca navasiana]